MNISATRKVSGSSGNNRKVSSSQVSGASYYSTASEQMVESIDASNMVSVNPDAKDDRSKNKQQSKSGQEFPEKEVSSNKAYIPGAVEALAASGLYEEHSRDENLNKKVGVYGANQTMVKDDAELEQEKFLSGNYIKHLYEKNEHLEEVDEFV